MANLDSLWAESQLRNEGGELAPESVYHLMVLATGNEAEAARARTDAILRERLEAFKQTGGKIDGGLG